MPVRIFATVVLAACFLGCSGGSEGRKPTHVVTGQVTYGGGPVSGASVFFAPTEGQPVAIGKTDESGNYTLTTYETGDGAAEGKYIVVVTKKAAPVAKTEALSPDDPNYGQASHEATEAAGSGSLLPEKYSSSATSDLEAIVKAGEENKIDLALVE